MPKESHTLVSNRLPSWFKQPIPDREQIKERQSSFRKSNLATVCEGAHCPNMGQCWARGTATFMILGDVCTRRCRFCAVESSIPKKVDSNEPFNVAVAIRELALKYVVVTSVTRDDLSDGGAGHFARTIREIRAQVPGIRIEVLIPDLSGKIENLKIVTDARPDVIGHNVETVSRLTKKIRPQADYKKSLEILKSIKNLGDGILVKSGFMVGLGETHKEIIELMQELRDAGCDILTVGQYLAPSKTERHLPVRRFVTPEEFERYRSLGLEMGFRYVASEPLVRSSYRAGQGYEKALRSLSLA